MYHNPFASGYEAFVKTGYSIDSHGSLANTPSYLAANDFPNYAGMFYSPTEHEVFSQIKYGNFSQDYSNLREVQAALNGPPMEFYIPSTVLFSDGPGRQIMHSSKFKALGNSMDKSLMEKNIMGKMMERNYKESVQEILKAQDQVRKSRIKIEFEDTLIIRKRKRTIIFEQ